MDVLVLVLGPVLVLTVVGPVLLVVLGITARPDHTLASEVASARRHGAVTAALAQAVFVTGLALLVALATRQADDSVRPTPAWLGAVPLLTSVLALLVLAIGEATWPRPRGHERLVNVNPRTLRDLLPRAWSGTLAGLVLLLGVVIAFGWWASEPGGRSIEVYHSSERLLHIGTPFPGAAYGGPQLLALGAAVAVLLALLRLVVLRPAVVGSDVATDNRLRAASVVRAVRLVASAVALTAAGNLFFGGSTAVAVHDPGWEQNLGLVGMLLGALLGLAGVVLPLAPAPRLPRREPATQPQRSVTGPS